ncbi:MAG: mechanosensitive ion channel family protein [Candidatus Cloacimonadales bacterium]
MIEYIAGLLPENSLVPGMLRAIIILVIAGVICMISKLVLKLVHKLIVKSKATWDDYLIKRKVLASLVPLPGLIFIYQSASALEKSGTLIGKLVAVVIIFVILRFLGNLMDFFSDIYNTMEIAEGKSIKGFTQILMIILYIIGFIVAVSIFINTNPWVLISGLGAMTAVLLLIFQDTILSFVASVRISTSDIIRIGDWLEVPKFGADGDVIDISLYNVSIQNWDKTITNIPSFKLINDSFKNWRGMQESGGRRIKRTIIIDISSVKFLDDEMIAKFEKIHYLKDYILSKQEELAEYNEVNNIDDSVIVNGRRMTNLGTFRAYITSYLRHHPKVHKELTFLIRQLQSDKVGVPIEIYVFTNDTAWVNYEGIQADIFDHLFAVAPEFGLRVFQDPSNYNYERISNSLDNIAKNSADIKS